MRPVSVLIAVPLAGLALLVGCAGTAEHGGDPEATAAASSSSSAAAASGGFAVSSPAFANNAEIPVEYSCEGRNVSPPLHWHDVPRGTESLAVVVDDPDAPAGLYVHWVVTGVPASTTELVAGALPQTASVSLNSANRADYQGPCPPAGSGAHHYRFKVYALSEPLTLTPATPATESTTTIAGLSLAVAATVGLFGG